jgi:hypothetical protein
VQIPDILASIGLAKLFYLSPLFFIFIVIAMTTNIEELFLLLIIFQIKHFISDFPLQREYMLKKTMPGWEFVPPLALHCAVHSSFTLAIVLAINTQLWWLAALDFVVHFSMDRIKSGPKYLGRFHDRDRPGFWNALGFDQMVHHFTHYYIIWVIIHAV